MFESTPKPSRGDWCICGAQPFMQGGARRIHIHNQLKMRPPASWLIKSVRLCVFASLVQGEFQK